MFQITLYKQNAGSLLVAMLQGELDHHEATHVREVIDKELDSMPVPLLLLDLEELSFMDSSGLGVILGRYKKVQGKRGQMAIANVPPSVSRLFEMSGLHKIMRLYSSQSEALRSMKEVTQ